jgi:prepilin-type N-terminal cleavage/methylation domain-containing protein
MRGFTIKLRSERGFTLVETLCALLVLSCATLVLTGLWRTAQSQQRQADLLWNISREAAKTMEAWRVNGSMGGPDTRTLTVKNTTVHEQKTTEDAPKHTTLTLTYSWQTGGRNHAETWTSIRRK